MVLDVEITTAVDADADLTDSDITQSFLKTKWGCLLNWHPHFY